MWEAKYSSLLSELLNKEEDIHGIRVNYQQLTAQRWQHQPHKQKHSENRFLDNDIEIVSSHRTGKIIAFTLLSSSVLDRSCTQRSHWEVTYERSCAAACVMGNIAQTFSLYVIFLTCFHWTKGVISRYQCIWTLEKTYNQSEQLNMWRSVVT